MKTNVLAVNGSWRPDLEEFEHQEFAVFAQEVAAELLRRRLRIDEAYENALREDLQALDDRERRMAALTRLPQDAERKAQMWMFRATELERAALLDGAGKPVNDRAVADARFEEWQREAEVLWHKSFANDIAYQAWKKAKEKAAEAARVSGICPWIPAGQDEELYEED